MLHAAPPAEESLPGAGGGGGLGSARTLLTALEARAATLRDRNAELVDRQRILGLALATGHAGVWQCSLRDNAVEWTEGVYDMFDLPRGARLRREETVACYAEPSQLALSQLRTTAIRTGTGFNLDAEIITPKGSRRWIRITAAVERENGVATRLYGMKQDITEARSEAERARRLAEVDAMTGLANRAVFEERISDAGRRMSGDCASSTLLLIDLDGFKQVNDTFGHALGDECLKAAAARLRAACGEAELVARIGGDEFAVLLGGHLGRAAIERVARAIVEALRMTVERDGRTVPIGASVGVALSSSDAPWRQFGDADAALYAAKAAGRGAFRVFGDICAPPKTRERTPILATD